MKVYIAYKTTNDPWGGGNQFIRFLSKELEKVNLLSNLQDSDIVLFNSHQNAEDIVKLKNEYPEKKFIHRIDGPMRLYNQMSDDRDDIVYHLNQLVADGSVFQSQYSLDSNMHLGFLINKPHCIIHNQADPNIFFPKKNAPIKNRIISTSWSSNIKKGFDTYKYLDQNLDFQNIEYVFAGNSPYQFTNIKTIGALTSVELANELRNSSLYVTCSENDPCSNSLIESISTHTPVLALKSGGHPELINESGKIYVNKNDLVTIINNMLSNIKQYKFPQKESACNQYINFFKKIHRNEK